VHPELGVGAEFEAAEKNAARSMIKRRSAERWVGGNARARSRRLKRVPPSGSRLPPKPEMGSLLTPKTPTGFPVAFWKATACVLAGNPEPDPLR